MGLFDEVVDACDVDTEVARTAVRRGLRESGCNAVSPSVSELRRALPQIRRALEAVMPADKAYDAVERVDILLAVKPSDVSSEPPSLEELTKRLREANQRMSSRDYEAETAEAEVSLTGRRRSIFPSSR